MPADARTVQSGKTFWVEDATGWQRVHAQVLAGARHVTIYGDPRRVSLSNARSLAARFATRIYPTDTRLFGLPRGMDHITILLTKLDGMTLGYFNQADLQPAADPAHSNGGNILYVRMPTQMPDKDKMADVGEVAAHELQHLINYRLRVMDNGYAPEENWLNEGLSFYAQLANRYFTPADRLKVAAAAAEPNWQVTAMPDSQSALLRHGRAAYGRAGLLVTYLANRFGPWLIRNIISDSRTGTAGIDDALKPAHVSAAQAFADWGVASLLDEPGVYGYGSMSRVGRSSPRLARPVIANFPYDSDASTSSLSMLPWTNVYLRFTSRHDGTLSLSVQTPPGHARLALVVQERGPLAPDVDWLHVDSRGTAWATLPHLGTQAVAATLVVADTATGTSPDRIRIRATLVDAGDTNGAS